MTKNKTDMKNIDFKKIKTSKIIFTSFALMVVSVFTVNMVGCSEDSNESKGLEQITFQKRGNDHDLRDQGEIERFVNSITYLRHEAYVSGFGFVDVEHAVVHRFFEQGYEIKRFYLFLL